jgi:hypothetical protein
VKPTLLVLALALAASPEGPSPDVPAFVDRADAAGIRVVTVSGDAKEKRFLLESIGGGLAVIDYDNDGWMDLYVAGGGTVESARAGTGNHPGALYRNNRDGTFTDVTAAAGLVNRHWGKGALAADFDNDGWMDLYLCNYGPNVLYLNNRNGTFRDATARAGVGDPRWSAAAAAADFDRDGKLDLFVANYLDYDVNRLPVSGKFCSYRGIAVACGPRGLKGAGDALYHNDGNGVFSDVSVKAGVSDPEGYYGLGAVWGDYDNDGWPDLFVANDTTPNYLYRNNRDGTFSDVATRAGVAFSEDGRAQAGMGAEMEDLDNDGLLDIMITTFSDDYKTLFRNTGKGYFRDDSHSAGLAADSMRDLSWGVGFFDFNNDGFKDVFIANGHIYPQVDRYGLNISYRQRNTLYLNAGNGKLRNASANAGAGLAITKSHRGAAFADFNNDGWMDVAVVALDEKPSLLMNQGLPGRHWLLIRLVGTQSNRFGVGARITVRAGTLTQTREVKAGGSYASSSDPRAHFGLGAAAAVDELTVAWPSGKTTRQTAVAADRILTIEEPK